MTNGSDTIVEELKRVNRLLTILITKDAGSQQDKFVLLNDMGLEPTEIAELTGAPQRTVSVTLSNIRRQEKSTKKKRDT